MAGPVETRGQPGRPSLPACSEASSLLIYPNAREIHWACPVSEITCALHVPCGGDTFVLTREYILAQAWHRK
ncbi:hypothetical protein SUGI_0122570 [Cryptomeria japonica]|nr:hypothetical protein SUGI_0122570 [Cryptomeria japonica]